MSACGASITWFREPGHVQVDDRCVLENGHLDYDHLAGGKAVEQIETRIWNAAIDSVAATVSQLIGEVDDDQTITAIIAMRK